MDYSDSDIRTAQILQFHRPEPSVAGGTVIPTRLGFLVELVLAALLGMFAATMAVAAWLQIVTAWLQIARLFS